MLSTMLIAVPTGVKVFNWTATMWKGSLSFEPPMLFALAFLFLFTIGGFSGLMLAIVPADFQYHDTYFVVAHFHYVLRAGRDLRDHGGVYYWLPKWTGHMYDMKLAKLALLAVGDLRERAVLPAALPRARRHAAPHPRLLDAVRRLEHGVVDRRVRLRSVAAAAPVTSSGSACRAARQATAASGRGSHGLEWELSSPPPYHSWTEPPSREIIARGVQH